MSINHHGQAAGLFVLTHRSNGEVTSFDTFHDILIWAMSKVPLDVQISEFNTVIQTFSDSPNIPTSVLVAHREHIDRVIDKRAMRNLQGSARTTKGS